jgi:hypothetical protein
MPDMVVLLDEETDNEMRFLSKNMLLRKSKMR